MPSIFDISEAMLPLKRKIAAAFDFLLFSNIFISICAVAQALVTYHLIKVKPSIIVLALLFGGTLCVYNFALLINKPHQTLESPYKRISFFFRQYRLMVAITITCIVCLAFLFFQLSRQSQLLLFFLSVLSFCYNMPLFSVGGRKIVLRNIPGLKPLMIALVWSLSSVLLPVFEANYRHQTNISSKETLLIALTRFIFIGAMTIPYDIRDISDDRKGGLKTLPVILGEKKAYVFSQIMFCVYLIAIIFRKPHILSVDFWALASMFAMIWWLLFISRKKRDEYFYFFYLDGVFILQYFMLLFFQVIF